LFILFRINILLFIHKIFISNYINTLFKYILTIYLLTYINSQEMSSAKSIKLFIVLLLLAIIPFTSEHGHSHGKQTQKEDHGHSHGQASQSQESHGHSHGGASKSETLDYLIHSLTREVTVFIKNYTSTQQAYLGAALVSAASFPIFLVLVLFRVHQVKLILNVFTAFSAGALLGEVFVHSIPEMYAEKNPNNIPRELIICIGIIIFYMIDKLLGLFGNGHSHAHHDDVKTQNTAIYLFGDILHNVADGLAIGAAFYKNETLGIGLTVGIFFHEIPHEVGDFSYLLKQNLGLFNVFLSQLMSAGGAFLGVYLCTIFGETYSTHILCFSCGSFLYLSINTILGDLKSSSEDDGIFEQFCYLILESAAVAAGVFFMTYFV